MTTVASEDARLSQFSQELRGSEILRIAAEIRAMIAAGKQVVNLTVGDFNPKEFRIPKALEDAVIDALRAGESNYPPSPGIDALRAAVQKLYAQHFGKTWPIESILVTAGARPIIYAIYRCLVDAGDQVVFSVPGWNNELYCDLV